MCPIPGQSWCQSWQSFDWVTDLDSILCGQHVHLWLPYFNRILHYFNVLGKQLKVLIERFHDLLYLSLIQYFQNSVLWSVFHRVECNEEAAVIVRDLNQVMLVLDYHTFAEGNHTIYFESNFLRATKTCGSLRVEVSSQVSRSVAWQFIDTLMVINVSVSGLWNVIPCL